MKNIVFSLILLAASTSAFAKISTSITTHITGIYTYGQDVTSSVGDISLKVSPSVAGCEDGFWVSKSDLEANKNMAAFLLSAFHADSNVYIAAYTDEPWPGIPNGKYCKVHSLGLVK